MESLLREILVAQRETLDELRQIRLLLARDDRRAIPSAVPDAVPSPGPGPEPIAGMDEPPPPVADISGDDQTAEPAEFTLEPETPPAGPPPSPQPVGTFTPSDLKDLGASFASPRLGKSRPGLIDVQDLRGSLLDEIKGKNRAKSRAYSEFTKNRRDD